MFELSGQVTSYIYTRHFSELPNSLIQTLIPKIINVDDITVIQNRDFLQIFVNVNDDIIVYEKYLNHETISRKIRYIHSDRGIWVSWKRYKTLFFSSTDSSIKNVCYYVETPLKLIHGDQSHIKMAVLKLYLAKLVG